MSALGANRRVRWTYAPVPVSFHTIIDRFQWGLFTRDMAGRDIVFIGGSAGGIPAVQQVMAGLPAKLSARLFIVIHSSPDSPGILPQMLNNAGALPAAYAEHRQRFECGQAYVAPPDRHLLLDDGVMHVTRGRREIAFRPAVVKGSQRRRDHDAEEK